MLLNAKKLAFLGLLLAFADLLIIFSGILEFNTLFLLAAASFCVGIAIRETDIRIGFGFYLACIFIGIMLAPNKLYCITFAAMGLYLVLMEYSWGKVIGRRSVKDKTKVFWMVKYLIFNLIFIPMILFFPKLIYQGSISPFILLLMIIGGQVALYLYDYAYHYFQSVIWGKLRMILKL